MDRKSKRTIISIKEDQPHLDFEDAEETLPFTFPEYQRDLLTSRFAAGVADLIIVGAAYLIFVSATYVEMPANFVLSRRVAGIYGAGFFVLLAIYFLLFMISSSQTLGMRQRKLTAVTKDGQPLDLPLACLRGFGYLVCILPLMLGFVWAVIDPDHLTWADKVSGTYVKKI